MLSAAMAAILAGAALSAGARADTTVAPNTTGTTALATSTSGNILIQQGGGISVKSATPAVNINSNNSLANYGAINNLSTTAAVGVEINTAAGDIVSPNGVFNAGAIDLGGTGTAKIGLLIGGQHTFYGPITLSEVNQASLASSTTNATSAETSTLTVQGDNSYLVYLVQGTTVDGNISLGGTMTQQPSASSTATGAVAVQLDGNIQGNLVFDQATSLTTFGSGARGVVLTGSITPCVNNPGLSYTCATTSTITGGTALGNAGAFVNAGALSSTGTTTIKTTGNTEGGSALTIGGSIAGGFVNQGPATANNATPTASIVGNGATISGNANPSMLIDPSATLNASNSVIRGAITFGVVPSTVDSADGGVYSFINHGLITTRPLNQDESVTGLVINGASPTYTTTFTGGLLNTGTIQSTTTTSVNTNSTITSNAFTVGSYATIPRIVVAGEQSSATTFTSGTVNALISGLGGGTAVALGIQSNAHVPEIDVLQHGTIAAQISTSTTAPSAVIANTKTPFVQAAIAVIDASGTVKKINNAGSILALTTQQNPAAGSVVSNTTHAIDLSAGSTGGTAINNSGRIQGDISFNAGGGSNQLNVGNSGASLGDTSGGANSGVTAAQGTAVTNSSTNFATVSGLVISSSSGFAPTTNPNLINFGSGTGNQLHVGGYGYVNSVILGTTGGLDVEVDANGQLYVANTATTGSLNANTVNIYGGVLGLSISQASTTTTPVIQATGAATLSATSQIGLQFGSFISAADPAHPTAQTITLIRAPSVTDNGLANQNATLAANIPFLFESPSESGSVPTPLATGTSGGQQVLTLTLLPRSTGAKNADGTAGLKLSGAALKYFPYSTSALANDPTLGTAIASSLTVYNNNAGASSGINIAASQQKAQQIFSQFAPDVSGGARAVAVMITDQATGPVAARQRLLRSYSHQDGEMTLWGEEFAGMIKNTGRYDGEGALTTYADHGFGFSLGMDAGSPRGGWYGGALTFYSSDVIETLPRQSRTNIDWYMLSGYTDWRGGHVFLDTKLDIGYGNVDGQRILIVGNQARAALGKRASLLGSLGGTTGLLLKYGTFDVTPHISLDGMTMREEGYTETGGGDGLDLQVAPYYATSLRTFLGVDAKTSFSLWDATLSPEARLGYRYDLAGQPVKLKTAFASTGGLTAPNNSFTVIGPDPDRGNMLAGFSLGGGTDTWNIGINYDWIRGNNASTTQMGTITLLGRI